MVERADARDVVVAGGASPPRRARHETLGVERERTSPPSHCLVFVREQTVFVRSQVLHVVMKAVHGEHHRDVVPRGGVHAIAHQTRERALPRSARPRCRRTRARRRRPRRRTPPPRRAPPARPGPRPGSRPRGPTGTARREARGGDRRDARPSARETESRKRVAARCARVSERGGEKPPRGETPRSRAKTSRAVQGCLRARAARSEGFRARRTVTVVVVGSKRGVFVAFFASKCTNK